MRATHTAFLFLLLLVLMHLFIAFPSPSEQLFLREDIHSRKLLVLKTGQTNSVKPTDVQSVSRSKPKMEVNASLKKMPSSKSNPSQN
jgi:hypothetical protein